MIELTRPHSAIGFEILVLKPLKHPFFQRLIGGGHTGESLLEFFLVEFCWPFAFSLFSAVGKNLNRSVEKLRGWVTKRIVDFNRLLSVQPTQQAVS